MPGLDVTICSYDLTNDSAIFSALSSRAWDVVVLDEVHFLKEIGSARAKNVLGAHGLVHRATRTWALSGTPAPNHPGELWTLLFVFGITTLTRDEFYERYCATRERRISRTRTATAVVGGRNLDELKSLISPHMLRRKKEEVMKDLPPITFGDVVVEGTTPDDLVRERYFLQAQYILDPSLFGREMDKAESTLKALLGDVGLGDDGLTILKGLDGRKEIKSLRRWTGLQKVPAVLRLVRNELEANAYEKIVLFAVHRDVIEELRDGLRDLGAVTLYGQTPADKRDRNVQRFQNDPKCRVFIGQIIAAGTAITLTAAHQVMVVEADWVPANNSQAVMRCHRIGQTKPVTVRFAGMANSIDERIQRVLKQKTRTLTQIFS